MSPEHRRLLAAHGLPGDPEALVRVARERVEAGDLHAAASAYDYCYGLNPGQPDTAEERRWLLGRLSITDHGLRFRYVPAGTFLMGSDGGEPDEQPVHPVRLERFWISETPITWADYCRLLGWSPPPEGRPLSGLDLEEWGQFKIHLGNRIRLQYCENETTSARDWHAHVPDLKENLREYFKEPPRSDAGAPYRYDRKPVVAVSWREAVEVAARMTGASSAIYRLPTEAEWERAARGGLVCRRYAWGDEPPDTGRCDFHRFDELSILPSRRFPPNGYGVYAMCGGVWEWTADWYDADYYRSSPVDNPQGPEEGSERVLRGGSWTDPAEAVTVTFRMSRKPEISLRGDSAPPAANIGFRLVRTEPAG